MRRRGGLFPGKSPLTAVRQGGRIRSAAEKCAEAGLNVLWTLIMHHLVEGAPYRLRNRRKPCG
jgi:hypothetical protein